VCVCVCVCASTFLLSNVSWVINIELQAIITLMYLMNSTSVSLLFNKIPKHIDSLAATSNKFKNSTVVETEPLH